MNLGGDTSGGGEYKNSGVTCFRGDILMRRFFKGNTL